MRYSKYLPLIYKIAGIITLEQAKDLLYIALNESSSMWMEGVESRGKFTDEERGVINLITEVIKADKTYPALSAKNIGKITVFNKVVDSYDPESDPDDKSRQVTTIGKYIKKKVSDPNNVITEILIKKISEYLKEYAFDVFGKIGGVEDIAPEEEAERKVVDYYKSLSKEPGKEDPKKSCMTDEDACKTQIYADNPNKVLLLHIGDKVRALLWKCDDGTIVLDRAYPAGSKWVYLLREWAKKKGYVLRSNPDKLDFGSSALSDDKEHHVTLDVSVTKFPYLDTFKFGRFSEDKTKLTLSNIEGFGELTFVKTDGSYIGEKKCADCERDLDDDETYRNNNDEPICENCYGNYYICEGCSAIIYYEDIVTFGDNVYCDRCYMDNFCSCTNCGTEMSKEDAFIGNDEPYCENCFFEVFAICEECGESVLIDNARMIDDKFYCSSCLDNFSKCEECYSAMLKPNKFFDDKNKLHMLCDNCFFVADIYKCKYCGVNVSYELDDGLCKHCVEMNNSRL